MRPAVWGALLACALVVALVFDAAFAQPGVAGGIGGGAGLPAIDAGVPDAPVDAPVDAAPVIDAMPYAGPHVPSPEELEQALEERTPDAPVIEAPVEAQPGSAESTWFALKLIFGIAILLALTYIGGHPRALRLQERLGLRGVVLAGFPFIAIGLVAGLPSVGVLTDDVLPKLRPLLQFGLGWIGFIIGAHLDIKILDRVPRGTAYLILIEAIAPFAVTAVAAGAVMISVFGQSLGDPATWRDVVLLGAAAAMTAPRRFRGLANVAWREGRGADVLLGQLDEIVGVLGLLFITAYFRGDQGGAWQLPGTAWLFVEVGLGVVVGVLIYALIRLPGSSAEFLAIVLGSLAFASGLASVLRVSPLVVSFVAGTLITNFPNEQRADVFRILTRLEHPIHLLFLVIAGALWNVSDGRGWLLVPLFVVCRIVGKWLGILTSRATLRGTVPDDFIERRSLILPMSTMALALVVSVERFRSVGLAWVVTAVIGSSIIFEAMAGDGDHDEEKAPAARPPIDELDERGPMYDRDDFDPKPPAEGGR